MPEASAAPPETRTGPPRATHALAERRSAALHRVLLAVVLAIAAGNVLWRMTDANLGDWDEGRHAVSAYEMFVRGDLLVNTYRGAVDYWNLKPPLSFWPIIGDYALLGPSNLALRLPSALFFVATVACVAVFARRMMGRTASLVSAAALATCYPLIGSHSGRTGDPDALFVLLCTVSLLALFGAPERPRLLLLWTFAFSGAFLTKSWHAGLVLLIGVVFLAVRGRASIARRRDYAIALLGFLPVVAWAIARFSFDGTRFFTAMVQYDLLSRSSEGLETNAGGPLFYIERLAYLAPWVLLVLVPLVSAASRRAIAIGRWRTSAWIGPLIAAVMILGLFTVAKTKLPWYIYSAFPMLVLVIGYVAAQVSLAATRRVVVLTVVATVLAAGAGEAYVLRKIPGATVPAQTALGMLTRNPSLHGLPVYLDAPLQSHADDENERQRAKVGEWPQSLRAAALIDADLRPQEGGLARFASVSGPRLAVVNSGALAGLEAADVRVVARADDVVVVEAG